ncbi:MAG TPA: substrate-binding domain-containing protein [Candidatus Eisenbacteria bacterium]|nr:substrate-binding domain-containing protein [Candidatus Eisenbacteria bacterium]
MGLDMPMTGRRKRASMREVADMADVAISSVSRVLSGHPDVSAEMRDRVLAAVAELDYEPDFLAQSLRRGATLSVGYVVGDISNPLIATITLGAEAALRSAGYSMLLMNSENEPDLDAAHIRFFQARRVDGMILSLASDRAQSTIDAIAQVDVPVVLIDRDLPVELRASIVRNDHRSGMRSAVDHLLDLGHRRIALITGGLDLWPVRERLAGMAAAVAARGIPDETVSLIGSLSAEHGEASTEQLLTMVPRPTAIIAGGNQVLAGCVRALVRHGTRIPEDVSLVTCDEVDLSELHTPPIASISRDTLQLGRVAAELLLERVAQSAGPRTVLLPTRFTPTASLGPVPGG